MPYSKKLGIAFVTGIAASLTMVATASAADPLLEFGGENGAIAQVGAGTLTTLAQLFELSCAKAAGKLEAANKSDSFKGELEFKECTATGLGLASGIIKIKIKGLTCLWGALETELKPCAYIETSEDVHLEVPVLGLVDILNSSSQACKLSPDGVAVKELKLECGKACAGCQMLAKVKDLLAELKPEIFLLENHQGSETMGAIESKLSITYAKNGLLTG